MIDALWEEIRWGMVLVHSLAGVNRAPLLAAAWMHVVGCMTICAGLADFVKLHTVMPDRILLESVVGAGEIEHQFCRFGGQRSRRRRGCTKTLQ